MLSSQDEHNVVNTSNIDLQQEFHVVLLAYDINQLVEPNAWNREVCPILIFRTMEFLEINLKNIFISLLPMANYIRNKKIEKDKANNISKLKGFSEVA